MKPKLLFFLLLLITFIGNAQPPWRAQLFVHFYTDSGRIVTDTVWFGCDSLGAEGYQEGLDVIDTNLQWNKVYSADDLIKAQYNTDCANLKTNIRGFKKKESYFTFYAIGNPVSMSWDTLDFMYFDSTYRLCLVEIRPLNGYIASIDRKYYEVAGDSYSIINGQYIYRGFWINRFDSVEVIPESRNNGCTFSRRVFEFRLNIYMGWQDFTGLEELIANGVLSIYPNPFSNSITIRNTSDVQFNEAVLYNMQGEVILKENLNNELTSINTSHLAQGIYYLCLNGNKTQYAKPIKLIKL
jgi:hypothetical protein